MKNYSASFWYLSFSMLLFMASFNLILPELNAFISHLGGENSKGLIITVFTISAAISRPFSGKLSDYIGRKKVIYIGIIVCILVSLMYPLSTTVLFFLFLRFLHGFSAGFMPTGATALVTDLLPSDKRGMGMGVFGTFMSIGIGLGQSMSFLVVDWLGLKGLFVVSSLLAVLSSTLLLGVNESLQNVQKFKLSFLKIKWNDVFEPNVLPAAFVMFLTAAGSGIMYVLSAEISVFLHIQNKGHFFLFYVLSTIFIRLLSGKLSDKIGRRKTLVLGVTVLIFSLSMVSISDTVQFYTFSSILFGVATGIISPTLFAWTADLSATQRRGVGAGTLFIALESGIMLGSFSTTYFYDNTFASVKMAISVGIVLSGVALLFLLYHLRFKKSAF